jgi:hypothetical protein
MRERVVQEVVQFGCTNNISLIFNILLKFIYCTHIKQFIIQHDTSTLINSKLSDGEN